MTLAAAFKTIADSCGLSPREVEIVVSATAVSAANRREMVRLARRIEANISGGVRINLLSGSITSVRYDLTSESLERMRKGE